MTQQAQIVLVADAAVAQIVAAQAAGDHFPGLLFKPERSYAHWDDEVTECQGLLVDVVPSRYERSDLASRTRHGYQCSFEIYVRQKFGPNYLNKHGAIQRATIDRLTRHVEELHELFAEQKRPPANPEFSWLTSAIVTVCSRTHLRTKQQFFGSVKVTYDAPKVFDPQ